MKTIEERARKFVEKAAAGQKVPSYISELLINCYCAAVEEEHALLTKWHDAKEEHPKSGLTVLIKCVDIRFPNQSFFTTGVYYASTRQWCAGRYGKHIEIVGWREIHE